MVPRHSTSLWGSDCKFLRILQYRKKQIPSPLQLLTQMHILGCPVVWSKVTMGCAISWPDRFFFFKHFYLTREEAHKQIVTAFQILQAEPRL